MSCIKTKPRRNRGTADFSHSLTSKNKKKVSAPKVEKISRFFTKASNENIRNDDTDEMDTSGKSFESPYKNCLNKVKCEKMSDSTSDLDDFKTPTSINKVSKMVQLKAPKNLKKRKKKTSSKAPMRKFLEDNFKGSDVNPEHLQMALALSESSYDVENYDKKASSQEKMESFKKALEIYGFGYGKNRVEVENRRDFLEVVTSAKKNNKKSRYRYITPILKIRTPREREDLISSKVSLILAQNNRISINNDVRYDSKLFCESLQKYHSQKIFKLNHLELKELSKGDLFYVGLEVGAGPSSCGHMLKNWGSIAGREISPIREISRSSTTSNSPIKEITPVKENLKPNLCKQNTPPKRSSLKISGSISPDLFGSDDEYQDPASFDSNNVILSPNLSPRKAVEKVECYDLTQSDHEDSSQINRLVKSPKRQSSFEGDYEIILENSENLEKIDRPSDEVISPTKLYPLKPSEEMKCYDLTQSDEDDMGEAFYLKFSDSQKNELFKTSRTTQKRDSSPEKEKITLETIKNSGNFHRVPEKLDEKEVEMPNTRTEELKRSSFTENLKKTPDTKRYNLSPSSSEESLHLTETGIEISKNIEKTIQIPASEHNYQPHSSENRYQSPVRHNRLSNCELPSPRLDIEDIEDKERSSDRSQSPELALQSSEHTYQLSQHQSPEEIYLSPEHEYYFSEHCGVDWIESPPPRVDAEMECYNLTESDDQDNALDSFSHENDISRFSASRSTHETPTGNDPEPSKKLEKVSSSEDDSKLSQESIYISDDELNYSSVYATPQSKRKAEGIPSHSDKNLPPLEDSFNNILNQTEVLKQIEPQTEAAQTPSGINTPNENFTIKTKDVTPMPNYGEMDTPKIVKELDKFGLKPLKRQRGAKLLEYLYESTHPVVEDESDDDERAKKKRRIGSFHFEGIVGDIEEDDWIFERTQLKRIASCRVPLHIVWHNFVMSNPKVRESILLYEPLQLEVLHSMLKEQGFKFNIQDLLTFLDRKCITIRTAQGQRYGKKPRK